jgi:transposase
VCGWRNGWQKKARVALARKLSVVLYRMWADGTEFRWTAKDAAA